MPEDRTVGGFVKKIRKRLGYTQKKFGKELGLGERSQTTVSNWERNAGNVSERRLQQMLDLLDPPLPLGRCLYFPDEVSRYQQIEAEVEGRKRKEEREALAKREGS